MKVVVRTLGLLIALGIGASGAIATQQGLRSKLFLVKDPTGGPQARKIKWRVKETDPDLSIVGDPTVDGATLRVFMNASDHCSDPPCEGGGDQCFVLPASGWSAIGPRGFKYKDAKLANGAAKVVSIKKTASGKFLVKAILQGAGIAIYLDDPIGNYAATLALGDGDEYVTGSGGVEPKRNDSTTFLVKKDIGVLSIPGCSPRGAFLD